MYKNVTIAILAILLITSTVFNCNKGKDLTSQKNIIELLTQDLERVSDSKVRIQVVNTPVKDILSLQVKDEEISRLQALISKYKKEITSAAVFTTVTKLDTIVKTSEKILTITNTDTIYKENFIKIHNDWLKLQAYKTGDSVNVNLEFKNDYEVYFKSERRNIFAKKKQYAYVTNNNPYSTTETLKVWNKTQKKTRLGVGVHAGYGLVYSKGSIIPGPILSVGVNYNIR